MNKMTLKNKFRPILRIIVPVAIRPVLFKIGKLFFYYNTNDSTEYWRKRAGEKGQVAVLWKNQEYNSLYRTVQRGVLQEFLAPFTGKISVLDVGCGIGIVAKMLVELHPDCIVDAVDFPEMVGVARKANTSERIHYIESSAENYCTAEKKYDLIVSSACISAIRDGHKRINAILNLVKMVDNNGTILFIDPFHSWAYLARSKCSSQDVIKLMTKESFQIIKKSGVLFWPYRVCLANSTLSGELLAKRFKRGEKLLSILGKHLWADYKILAFRR